MINISDKKNCCGCGACSQVCPVECIDMNLDSEGFMYPIVDPHKCIGCGVCERVCPFLNKNPSLSVKPKSYACKVNNERIRLISSSGGLFSVLAEQIIDEGGVVFGAKFREDWSVVHGFADKKSDICMFMGSKYVQSDISDNFKIAKEFLEQGRVVLFSGTPCQISGFTHFLGRKFENLITVDFACHSIPSPKVWKLYLSKILRDYEDKYRVKARIEDVSFRNKSDGWNNYGLRVLVKDEKSGSVLTSDGPRHDGEHILICESNSSNLFFKGFISGLYVRPCCCQCPARGYTSGSDITMADCWGFNKYHPNLNDNKGMSLALINTEKGNKFFAKVYSQMFVLNIPFSEVEEDGLHCTLLTSLPHHKLRKIFFSHLNDNNVIGLITSCLMPEELLSSFKDMIKNTFFFRVYLRAKSIFR